MYKGPSASRPASGISFEGFTSFEEVRRGFEFSGDRPGFYPPPVPTIPSNVDSFSFGSSYSNHSYVPANSSYNPSAARRTTAAPHKRHESVFSIASISSYGHVINPGSTDPFDYGALLMPSLRERPVSEDEGDADGMSLRSVSMSMSVDDTFAFVAEQQRLNGGAGGRGWRVRQRVESDASSFYFRAGAGAGAGAGHRRRESNMSVSSVAGMPPVSLYNRSGHSSSQHGHSRNDSSASSSSVAMSYAKHGANSGFGAWAASRYQQQQYRRDVSVDGDRDGDGDNTSVSVLSEGGRDFEAMRRERVGMGRPGIGEKMFGLSPGDDDEDEGRALAPPFGLTRIDASPLGMEVEQHDEGTYDYYDSILDGSDEPRRPESMESAESGSATEDHGYEDSIFEKTGYRSSMEVDGDDESSVFGRKVGGKEGQQQEGRGRGLFPPGNASSRLSMMSNQSLSVGGLSDGNAKEDDTMISVCVSFFFCFIVFGVDGSLLFFRCSEADTLAVVPSGPLSKRRHVYA